MLKSFKVPFSHIIRYQKRLTCQFETVALNVRKWPWTLNMLKGQRYPYGQILPRVPTFVLWLAIFKLQAILRQVHWMTPNTKRSNIPLICNDPQVPNFNPFRSTSSRFRVTGHFETSALIDPQMMLNTKRFAIYIWKICQLPVSKISNFSFTLANHVQVTGHFERNALNDPKMTLNTKRSKICYNYPQVSNFTVRYMARRFQVAGHFATSAPNNPQIMTLNTKSSNIPHVHVTTHHKNFHAFCSMASCFRVIGHFVTSVLKDHKMTLNTKRSKLPHNCIHITS